jgi:hypothetical protein
VGWADMYSIMGYSGPIRIGPSIRIISIFSDTLWICIHDISDMYPYIGYISNVYPHSR